VPAIRAAGSLRESLTTSRMAVRQCLDKRNHAERQACQHDTRCSSHNCLAIHRSCILVPSERGFERNGDFSPTTDCIASESTRPLAQNRGGGWSIVNI